jgi:hypothetical protein
MKTKRITTVLNFLLMATLFVFTTSCDKDDDIQDPTDTVTLNMLDEDNGKTILGLSGMYINKANNFRASYHLIADCGSAEGIGVYMEPQLENLVYEAAVIPGHMYQVFDRSTISEFPSGARALAVNAAYYKVYVVTPIILDGKSAGATVKYISEYPEQKNLPEWGYSLGTINASAPVEMDLPEGAECIFYNGRERDFKMTTTDGKLKVELLTSANQDSGPYGTYSVYIRLGNIYSSVTFEVK